MSDVYQERYLEHIERKRKMIKGILPDGPKVRQKTAPSMSFADVIKGRKSQRIFNDCRLFSHEMAWIYEAVRLAPSSCNRQAIVIKVIGDSKDRTLLMSVLVGGRGWLSRSTTILLLFADMRAYKSDVERSFMPWLDAGFVASSVCLTAEALGLGACFVNPNIKEADRQAFHDAFNPRGLRFCGAVALGNYWGRDEARSPQKRNQEGIFYDSDV